MTACQYRPAGQDLLFPAPCPELDVFGNPGPVPDSAPVSVPAAPAHTARVRGWVGGQLRNVEVDYAPTGAWLKVGGVDGFQVTPQGILCADGAGNGWTDLEREILLGPALVLALAMRGTWCLHASAALFEGQVTVFVGESGQGKSTLAAHLAAGGHPLVADDILPVARNQAGLQAWPRFPQLKLQVQPGAVLSEALPLGRVCVLERAEAPALCRLPSGEAVQAWLRHTAGTRLFDPSLLAQHLAFCAQAAAQVPVFSLAYPRKWEALPRVRELLEAAC